MFVGDVARDLVMQHLNDLGNVTNLELNAHTDYDDLRWGIEAQRDDGKV